MKFCLLTLCSLSPIASAFIFGLNKDIKHNEDLPLHHSQLGEPTIATAVTPIASTAANATTTMMTKTMVAAACKKWAAASMVARCHNSTLNFRTHLTKSERNVHPCGILHFMRITIKGCSGGNSPSYHHHHHHTEEHAFVWITRFQDVVCLSSALIHM